jgi:D-inositol-3-phosphate glycosyltransferase
MLIGGDSDSCSEVTRLVNLAATLNVTGKINFIGPVPHEMLPDYYRAVDALVVPSYYESFGLVALEALASGTPVVAGEVGVMSDVIHNYKNGYLVPDTLPGSLITGLHHVLQGMVGAVTTSDISSTVAGYGWDIVGQSLEHELTSLCESLPALCR